MENSFTNVIRKLKDEGMKLAICILTSTSFVVKIRDAWDTQSSGKLLASITKVKVVKECPFPKT
jgi:hypothetical protein